AQVMLAAIIIKDDILKDEKYTYLFSVEAVNELVNQGVPFREAYQQVGNQIAAGSFHYDYTKGLHHTHEGSIGHLNTSEIRQAFEKVLRKFD
ncbi:MAG: argininosuccinate lyase, partial [Flaviaesturariibacter sp.]|nr:argininosuccinate lyase [Flaviaesturariibacter sp.]